MKRATTTNVILRKRILPHLIGTIVLALLPVACSAGSGDTDPGIARDDVASGGLQQELRAGTPDPVVGDPGLVEPPPDRKSVV